ncbi:hypothetical protein [Curtobacterium luteum]|uniref:Uncharacterized protein n=1 Tax=Curtobacterium luteum TaxID=33881 RepID=A0A175RTQ9_9MICO|nr:hypothetical protein [Curtobacterium luteum]KTR07096.1 hypothetical protein NS184_08210 [Curtobacterium luteum]
MTRGWWLVVGGAAVAVVGLVVLGLGVPRGEDATPDGSDSETTTTARTATASPGPGWLRPTNGLGDASSGGGEPEDGQPEQQAADHGPGTAPWWRRVPPVAGTLRTIDGRRIGHATVLASDGDTLTVTVVGDGRLPRTATRAVLTEDDRFVVELGSVTSGVRGAGFVLKAADADQLPDPVTTLELRDAEGRTIATATLLPV